MKELEQKILDEAVVLPGNIIKVDGFLNHRIDTQLLGKMADEFERLFDISKVDIILTSEASGIAPAAICSYKWNIPLIFAKKTVSANIKNDLYISDEIVSYTHDSKVQMIVSKQWLHDGDRVLIIDDFLARGQSVLGLLDIINRANAKLEGVGICIEKGFQGAGDEMREAGFNYHALAVIDKATPDELVFRKQ